MKLRLAPRGRSPYVTIAACAALAICTALGVAVYARQKASRSKAQSALMSAPGEIPIE